MPVVLKESFLEPRKSTRLFVSLALIILAIVLLLLPGILREDKLPIGDKSYYHLRMSENEGRDELSFSGRNNELSPGWNLILKFVPMNIALVVFGLITVLLLYLNLKSLNLSQRFLATGFFVLSPAFIYLFNVGERFGAAFMFSLLILYFLIKEKYILSGISFVFLPFFDYGISIFTLILAGMYWLYKNKKNSLLYGLLALTSLSLLIIGKWDKSLISDLGAKVGISIFGLVFVIFCLILLWNKKNFLKLYGVLALLIILSLKLEFGIFYLATFLSILLSLCFISLYSVRWESKSVRDITLLLVLCGLLFSGLSYANRISQDMPDENLFKALNTLPDGSVVLSGIEYGHWISYSGKKNVWDTFTKKEDFKERKEDLVKLLDSKDPFLSRDILDKYKVDFILIDEKLMKSWQEKGIFYLPSYNNEDFRLIYDDERIKIWRRFS